MTAPKKEDVDPSNFLEVSGAELLKMKQAPTDELKVCIDAEASVALERAKAAEMSARQKWMLKKTKLREQDLKDAEADLEAAKAAADAQTVIMKFRALGRKAYSDLLKAHPPTEEHQKEFDAQLASHGMEPRKLEHSLDSFPPALIAATLFEPKLTEKQAAEMWEEWSEAETEAIFARALAVQKLLR